MRRGRYDGYDLDYDDHDFDYDHEHMKDLTACDKECGYYGNSGYQSGWRTLSNTPLKVDGVWQQDYFDEMYLPGHYPDQTRHQQRSQYE